ncbi:hypothetical protein [Vibrio navarrensis]|uniref:Uncharacterized protein n=1 Tax=Vibrio navarrensis TaxID=29495 RepID=A0AAJ4LWV9_9VIBR|nr:hypothetical protein I3X05_23285 [Vibrio navarrensis]
MTNLHIVYGFCEDRHKAILFEHLVQNTSILKIKTIGHVAEKAVFAALTCSLVNPTVTGVHWIQTCIPNKKRTVNTSLMTGPALSRKKYHQYKLDNELIKQLQKCSRIYRKQRNLTLTEKNWRQHVNRKAALSEVECMFMPTCKNSFFLAHNQQPTPYSIWNDPKRKERQCHVKTI